MNNLFFWWSVVTTLLSIIFLIASIWQFFEGQKQTERIKAQVKNWMQHANGISMSLKRIVRDNLDKRYTSVNDIANAVWATEASAFSLYQALYEERCMSEEEYKVRQKKIMDTIEKSMPQTTAANESENKTQNKRIK